MSIAATTVELALAICFHEGTLQKRKFFFAILPTVGHDPDRFIEVPDCRGPRRAVREATLAVFVHHAEIIIPIICPFESWLIGNRLPLHAAYPTSEHREEEIPLGFLQYILVVHVNLPLVMSHGNHRALRTRIRADNTILLHKKQGADRASRNSRSKTFEFGDVFLYTLEPFEENVGFLRIETARLEDVIR